MTKSEARRKLHYIISQEGFNNPTYVVPPCESFSKRVEHWRETYLSRMKPSTQRTMNSQVNKYLSPTWGRYPVDGITAELVNEWLGKLAHLSPVTMRGVVKTLQNILGRTFEAKKIRFPSRVNAKREAPCFTPERTGELYGLRAEDVDFSRCILHVRRSVWDGSEQSPKSDNAYRSIDISPSLAEMLRSHLQNRTSGLVFRTRKGTPLRHSYVIRKVLHPVLKRLGIPRCGLHAFRHGRVSYLVENNTPMETIRAWIGHGSDQMVRRYTHLRPEYRKRILATIPALFGNQTSVIDPLPHFRERKK